MNHADHWPSLPLEEWRETYASLHKWTQIVGKIRLALSPLVNHWWNVPLYVTCRGLTTSNIPYGTTSFQIDFDFLDRALYAAGSDGRRRVFALEPMSSAQFYARMMEALDELGITVSIWPVPVEMPGEPVPFTEDHVERAYDPAAAVRFHRVLVQVDRVFNEFRAGFLGKASPVHFFWGAFDLAATRFSGREAPPHPGGIPNVGVHVMREAYSHEVCSAGFWPGGGAVEEAAFYAYAYPEPPGFSTHPVEPNAAYYHPEMGEYILPYDAVRTAVSPDDVLLRFLQGTYEAAANLGDWDRTALERPPK